MGARAIAATDAGRAFIERYPGHPPLPDSAPVGFPIWLNWAHFFNAFLMLLIIRTGIQVRREQKPSAYWRRKSGKGKKISLTLWFHQVLDLLWVLNGAFFFVLLFATGQWMRIVPTTWEVFPHALSALLQYLTLEWPTENGWVHYNGLQQLAYFVTVFVAAPLAILSGVRMSDFWPKQAERLNRLYPAPLARKTHFPLMIYFIAFIVVHVALVFATGALRNLNHMYAAQGSEDPTAYAGNWLGFVIFLATLVLMAGAWVASRPALLAPVARLFGEVTAR